MLVLLVLGTLPPQSSPTGLWIPLAPSKVQSSRVQFGSITISLFMHLQGLLLTSPWLESLYNATHFFKNDYLQDWP